MKIKIIVLSLLTGAFLTGQAFAQDDEPSFKNMFNNKVKHPAKKFYAVSAGELVFSFGLVEAHNYDISSKLRFSLFPHIQEQFHYNFGKSLGFYTGASLINLGFINDYSTPEGRNFELRQRALAVGVPVALKLGNMEDGNFIAIGGSAEIMTQYKTKFYHDGQKIKDTEWFSDKVNLFNPSVFLDFRNKNGFFIRFKYYLNDFLRPVHSTFSNPGSNYEFVITPDQSTMFYISIGTAFMRKKDPKKMTREEA